MSQINYVDLEAALGAIEKAYKGQKGSFFYYLGAGVSAPEVSLAGPMVRRLQEKRGPQAGPLPSGYVACMQVAWQHPDNLSSFVLDQVPAEPGQAQLVLARALLAGVPSPLAVTGNFDDHLSRAIETYGESLEKLSLTDLDQLGPAASILHLQGAMEDYHLEGLRPGPVDLEAGQLEGGPLEVGQGGREKDEKKEAVKGLLAKRTALVLGFSGQVNNPFMRALYELRKEAEGRVLAYWFLHRPAAYAGLPAWLKNHPGLVFVGPRLREQAQPSFSFELREKTLSQVLGLDLDAVLETKEGPFLPALKVLEGLVARFDLALPDLVDNPGAYLKKKARSLRPWPAEIVDLIAEKQASFFLEARPEGPLDPALTCLSRYQARKTLDHLQDLDEKTLGGEDRLKWAGLFCQAIDQLGEQPAGLEAGQVESLGHRILSGLKKDKSDPAQLRRFSVYRALTQQAFYQKAYDKLVAFGLEALGQAKKIKEAGPSLGADLDRVRYQLALAYGQRGQLDQALDLIQDAPFRREELAGKENRLQAYLLWSAGRYPAVYDLLDGLEAAGPEESFIRLLSLYQLEEEAAFIKEAQALLLAGTLKDHPLLRARLQFMLADLSKDRPLEEVKAWNKVIQTLADKKADRARLIRAQAMRRKALALKDKGSLMEALRVLEQIEADFAQDLLEDMQLLLARVGLVKAGLEAELTWFDKAKASLAAFVDRYQDRTHAGIKQLVIQGKYAWAMLSVQTQEEDKAQELFQGLLAAKEEVRGEASLGLVGSAHLELARLFARQEDEGQERASLEGLIDFVGQREEKSLLLPLASAYQMLVSLEMDHRAYRQASQRAEEGLARLSAYDDDQLRAQLGDLLLLALAAYKGQEDLQAALAKAHFYLDLTGKVWQETDNEALKTVISRILAQRGLIYLDLGKKELALSDLDDYVLRFADLDDQASLVLVYEKRGLLQRQLGQTLHAHRSFDEAIGLIRQGKRGGQVRGGQVRGGQGRAGQGKEAGQRALPQALPQALLENPEEILGQAYLEKAFLYLEEEKYDQQLQLLEEMEEVFSQEKDQRRPLYYRMRALYEQAKNQLYQEDEDQALQALRRLRLLPYQAEDAAMAQLLGQAVHREMEVLLGRQAYQQVVNITDLVVQDLSRLDEKGVRDELLRVLLDRQKALKALKDYAGLVANAQTIEEAFAYEEDESTTLSVQAVMLDSMEASLALRQSTQAEALFKKMDRRVHGHSDLSLKALWAQAIFLQSDLILEEGTAPQATDLLARVETVFKDDSSLEAKVYISQALYRKGKIYAGIGNSKKAQELFDRLISAYGHASDGRLALTVYKAMMAKASILSKDKEGFFARRRLKKAHQAYDRIIEGLGGREETALARLRAKAIYRKGKLYQAQNKSGLAANVQAGLIEDYGDHPDPYVQSLAEKVKAEG